MLRLIPLLLGLLPGYPGFDAEAGEAEPDAAKECVILLHGLARTSGSLRRLAGALEGAGYAVVNMDYPSHELPVEQLASDAVSAGLEACRAERAVWLWLR